MDKSPETTRRIEVIDHAVTSICRSLEFKKSGRKFFAPIADIEKVISLEKSTWAPWFNLDLGVALPELNKRDGKLPRHACCVEVSSAAFVDEKQLLSIALDARIAMDDEVRTKIIQSTIQFAADQWFDQFKDVAGLRSWLQTNIDYPPRSEMTYKFTHVFFGIEPTIERDMEQWNNRPEMPKISLQRFLTKAANSLD